MVLGMNSGKSGDGHRSGPQSKADRYHRDVDSSNRQETQGVNSMSMMRKHQPSAEQVHIARMLTDDRTPDDMSVRVQQVQAVVDCSEESICIALHDNEFDVRKACETLLDSNGTSKHDEWTLSTSKKSKKKSVSVTDQQAQKKTAATNNSRGSSKAAAQHTRQNYGGSVKLSTDEGGEEQPPIKGSGSSKGRDRGRDDTERDSSRRDDGGRDRGRDEGGRDRGRDDGGRDRGRDDGGRNRGRNDFGRDRGRNDGGRDRGRSDTGRDRGRNDGGNDSGEKSEGRVERTDKSDKGARGDRNDRGRGDRNDRGRGDRNDRGRGDRSDKERGDRNDRGRGDRNDRGRGDRNDRGRGDRSDRGRGDKSEKGRSDRTDRGRGDRGWGNRGEEGRKRNEGHNITGGSFEGRFPPRHSKATEELRTITKDENYEPNAVTPSNIVPEETWVTDEDNDHILGSPPPPSEDWVIVDTPPNLSTSLFPDALGRHPHSPLLTDDMMCIDEDTSVSEKSKTSKRKFKASQIPDQPVEMPGGIEVLTHDMNVLGIDFGVETTPLTTPISDTPTSLELPVSSSLVAMTSSEVSTFDQHSTLDQVVPTNNSRMLSSPAFADIADDPVIISSYKEKPPGTLEPPPGLVHPSQQSTDKQKPSQATSLLPSPPEPISLPPLTTPTQAPPTSTILSTGISSESHSHASSTDPVSSYPVSVLGGLHSVATGNSFSVATTSIQTTSTQPMFRAPVTSAPSSGGVSSGGVSVPQSSLSLSAMSSNPPPPTVSSRGTGSSHSSQPAQLPAQLPIPTGGNNKGHSSSGSGNSTVHPMAVTGMMYPNLLPQFPSPYGTAPVMMPPYTYDVDSMSRFPGFYGQHPTSQDQGGGASLSAGLGRDPQSGGVATNALSFGTESKYEGSAPNPTQQQQQTSQQTQQGAMQQPPNQMSTFYGHYPIYTMYPPHHMGLAATGYSAQPMAHKGPTATTNYPVGTSYQPTPQYPHSFDDDYIKAAYAASLKNQPVPSTTSTDFSAYSKHQFDNKASNYSNYMPLGTPMGGYMMGHHVPPMGTGPALMAHDASSRPKSHKYPATGTWPGQSTHS